MPRVDRKSANKVALSFYDAKLRHNPALRHACSDRWKLVEVINQWKAEQRLDGTPIKGVPPAYIIYGLKSKWKLIDSKINEEQVIIWSEDVDDSDAEDDVVFVPIANKTKPSANDKVSRIAKTVERIRNSRMELESNRNGIFIDSIDFGLDGKEGGICRLGHRVTQEVSIRNESDIDVICTIKGGAARQRGIVIERDDTGFELPAGSFINFTFTFLPKMLGITKSIVVFDFEPIDIEEEDSIEEAFSIVRYISIRAGDPDDYEIIKPIAPYIKKKKRYDDDDKFSNPVRVRSSGRLMSPFVVPLGRFPIPGRVDRLVVNEKRAMDVTDKMFRGGSSHFDESEKIDYPSLLDTDNCAKLQQHLLWIEEAQMKGKV